MADLFLDSDNLLRDQHALSVCAKKQTGIPINVIGKTQIDNMLPALECMIFTGYK